MAFRRKGVKKSGTSLPGCRPSPSNGLPVVASGVPSLDNLLGGGLHVGSCLVVEEDQYGSYARILLNLFAAEGVVGGHSLFMASCSETPGDMLEQLPTVIESVQTSAAGSNSTAGNAAISSIREEDEETADADSLKIAWRYENQKSNQGSSAAQQSKFSHNFDLSQKMALPATLKYSTFDGLSEAGNSAYSGLLTSLDEFVEKHSLHAGSSGILRLCLHSVGSPLWRCANGGTDLASSSKEMLQFFHALKARLCRWSAVAIVTVPAHLWSGMPAATRIKQLADYLVRVESFAGSSKQQNPLYKDYHGLFHILKLPCWSSLAPIPLHSTDWAFKLKKKSFAIDKLHLPPDLSETASRTQEDPVKPNKTASCLSGGTGAAGGRSSARSLDF